jgi:uncharacterized protein
MTAKPNPSVNDVTRPYWEAANREELHVQRCPRCLRHYLYPTPWCPHCWFTAPEWVKVSGQGSVFAYTVVHQSPLASYSNELPYLLAIIRLDEGPHLMTNIVGSHGDDVWIGMPVVVVFEARGDLKIPQFTAAAAAGEIATSRKARP